MGSRSSSAPHFTILAAICVALLLSPGCRKQIVTHPSVLQTTESEPGGEAWVEFDVVERGSMEPILTYIWVDGFRDEFESIMVLGESTATFEGFGRNGNGYVIPFAPGQDLTFIVWSEGHELLGVPMRLKQGKNDIYVELRKTEIADTRVPLNIWIDVLERMFEERPPTEGPKHGS